MEYISYNGEKLGFYLDNYANNGNLYVSLYTQNNEDYADLSINLPNYLLEFEEEIVINGDVSSDLVKKLVDKGILIDTFKTAYSGFETYKVMYFNREIAKDYIIADYSFNCEE